MTAATALATIGVFPLWTGSATTRVMECPSSAALPGIYGETSDDANSGQQVHRFLYVGITRGREAALEEIKDNDIRARCEMIDLGKLATVGEICAAEVAYAYDVAERTGRVLGTNLARAYQVNATEIPTTTDIELVAPDGVPVILDAKTGWRYVAPDTAQLRFHALAYITARKVERVRVGILKIDAQGQIAEPTLIEVDELDAGAFAHEVRTAWARIVSARDEIAHGIMPSVNMGEWCDYCPAAAACPSQVRAARAVLAVDGERAASLIGAMSPEEAGDLWVKYKAGEGLLEAIGAALRARAHRGPLVLPDGRTLEMCEQTQVRKKMIPDPSGETKTITFYVARPKGKAIKPRRLAP